MRVPRFVVNFLKNRLMPLRNEPPDEIIGHNMRSRKTTGHVIPVHNPFLNRWFVIKKNRWCNIYLHQFVRDDEDRALHDHPWWNISILLVGRYIEVTVGEKRAVYTAGDVKFRSASTAHRVELFPRSQKNSERVPSWSLFITGPVKRKWGFLCPAGWRSSSEFHERGGCND